MTSDFACEKKLAQQAPQLHRIFKDAVFCLQNILTSYQTIFPAYTDHTTLHSLQVIDFCNRLIGKNVEKMSVGDAFVLLMAAYFHDTGMGIRREDMEDYFTALDLPYSNDIGAMRDRVRKFHNEFSRVFIEKNKNFFDFPSEEIAWAVAQASRGHRKVDLFDDKEYPTVVSTEEYGDIHLPYITALIRLADEIDIAADRIPELLVDYDAVKADPVSNREFQKHHAIRHLKIRQEGMIMQVKTEDEGLLQELYELKDKVTETLLYCKKVIEERTPFTLSQSKIEIEILP